MFQAQKNRTTRSVKESTLGKTVDSLIRVSMDTMQVIENVHSEKKTWTKREGGQRSKN